MDAMQKGMKSIEGNKKSPGAKRSVAGQNPPMKLPKDPLGKNAGQKGKRNMVNNGPSNPWSTKKFGPADKWPSGSAGKGSTKPNTGTSPGKYPKVKAPNQNLATKTYKNAKNAMGTVQGIRNSIHKNRGGSVMKAILGRGGY